MQQPSSAALVGVTSPAHHFPSVGTRPIVLWLSLQPRCPSPALQFFPISSHRSRSPDNYEPARERIIGLASAKPDHGAGCHWFPSIYLPNPRLSARNLKIVSYTSRAPFRVPTSSQCSMVWCGAGGARDVTLDPNRRGIGGLGASMGSVDPMGGRGKDKVG